MLLSIADTFIKRPVLTTVCTIIIILAGAISIPLLPIAQLPQLANTEIQVSSVYIGADAQTTENTVTTILEREINGVEDMKYMYSNTSNSGQTSINIVFPNDVDRDTAQVNVQNRVSQAEASLPDSVRQTGITVEAASPNILLVIA
ncbi:MAG: hydrophobe/amphiphile efflux-1 family RND transporter, partial [Okeania sp. SIO3B5]|uniref:efflux RND transporter permease subunit n=1 Tax=Okeania sp. SIO3B5 TaxID=2607811 RepID=UPI0013FEAE60